MNHRLWIDLETYSTVDLRNSTPYRYAEDPLFQILMAAWSTDGKRVHMALGHEEIKVIPGLWDPQVLKVAHNAPFERICLSRLAGLPVGSYLPVREFHDTQAVAGVLGYPQKLASLAPALGAEPKDEAGTRLINLFCKPNRHGERNLPEDYPEEWEAFVAYCRQDVHTLIDVDNRLGDWPTEREREIYYADQTVNDTGLRLDVDLARHGMEAANDNRMVQELEIQAMTGVDNPGSQPQMMEWCRSVGLKNRNLREATVTKLLEGDLHDDVRRVLELRQELALVASKKYSAALDSVSTDGRLRGAFRYFGAHTGRWSGRGAQPQNLPRAQFEKTNPETGKKEFDEAAQEAAILDLMHLGEGGDAFTLKALVRAMFLGPLTVVDYSAIEARVIAWLAGEQWALEAFRAGRDIYVETAERMGGLDRSQGKVAVLALGYAGGVNSLKAMAGSGFYYDPRGKGGIITAGTLGEARAVGGEGAEKIRAMPDEQIREKLVLPWRRANPSIVQLWQDLQIAFSDTGQVGEHLWVTDSIDHMGRAVHIWLPSGRAITYHDVKWERYRVEDPVTGRPIMKEGFRYADPRNPKLRIGTYGGRLAENATQAVARDIMAEALVRLVSKGFRPVGHVHDEIISEGTDKATIKELMVQPPDWADGLPIDGEGFVCERYRKG